jgi:hypothetical protein
VQVPGKQFCTSHAEFDFCEFEFTKPLFAKIRKQFYVIGCILNYIYKKCIHTVIGLTPDGVIQANESCDWKDKIIC